MPAENSPTNRPGGLSSFYRVGLMSAEHGQVLCDGRAHIGSRLLAFRASLRPLLLGDPTCLVNTGTSAITNNKIGQAMDGPKEVVVIPINRMSCVH
jgi:hypothetical protein